VSMTHRAFVARALAYLASRGRRRLAVLCNTTDPALVSALRSGAAKVGMTLRPYWLQMVSMDQPEFARNVTHLLFHGGQADSPDALLVTDDNLVEHAIRGLVDAGVTVPGEVDVVAHGNFPGPAAGGMKVKRLGYDAREVLAACVSILQARHRGEGPLHREIPAVFEQELL